MGDQKKASTEEFSLEKLLDMAGSEGRYQKFLVIYTSFLSITMAFSIFSLAFIYYLPDFYCFVNADRSKMELCSEKEALNSQWGFRTFPSRISLVTDYNLYGEGVSLYKWSQAFISGYTLLFTSVLLLGIERIGRKWGYLIPLLLVAGGSIFNILFKGPKMAAFGLGNICTGFEVYYCVSPTHINESIGGKLRTRASSIAFCTFAFSAACFYFINIFFIGYEHIYILIFWSCVPGIIFFFKLKESPSFEFEKKNFAGLQKELIAISEENHDFSAHENAVKSILEELRPYIKAKKKSPNLFVEQFKKYGWRILGVTFIMGNLNFIYLTLSFTPQLIKGVGMCTTGILLMTVEALLYIIMSFFSPSCPRKVINVVCAAAFIVFAGLLIFSRAHFPRAEIAICLVIKGSMTINFSIITSYVVEVLPSELRTMSFLSIFLLGRALTTQIGRIIAYAERVDISPIPVIIPSALAAFFAAALLPETVDKPLIN